MNRRAIIALTPEEQREFLETAKTIILCTIDQHGYPHPLAMWYDVQDGAVLMTTYGRSQKVLNVQRNPKVALLVETGETYEALKGLMLRGKAEIIDDHALCVKVLTGVYRRMGGPMDPSVEEAMSKQARKRVVIKITPERTSSWDHAKLGGTY